MYDMGVSQSTACSSTSGAYHKQPGPTLEILVQQVWTELFVVLILFCFVFRGRVSLCSLGCPGTFIVEQAVFKVKRCARLYLGPGIKGAWTTT